MGTTEEEARTVYGDPDEFAGEMVKMINDKEFRCFCYAVYARVLFCV
jgi:hypothetical protein